MTIKKVALYLRKSRDEDAETREETLARHERMLRDYCKRNNLTVIKVYKEVVSAENLEDRPQALQMLDDVADGQFDGVVVIELERLSRGNQIDQVEVMETFKKSKTLIYTLNKIYNLSSDDEMDEEFFEFGLYMSRREYKTIKRRLMRGKKQAQKEGYYTGSHLPYGFDKVRGDRGYVLVPNEETEIVKLIFDKFVNQNYSVAEIVGYLNANGIKPLRAIQWDKATIRKLLKNKTYIGFIYANSGRSRKDAICYQGKHNAVIDEDIFLLAQEKLRNGMPRTKFGTGLTNPLASLVYCSNCGYAMIKSAEYLKCHRYGCKTVLSNFDLVEKRIIGELKTELSGFNYFLDNYGAEIEKKQNAKEKERAVILKQIDKKEAMMNKACEMLEMGIYDLDKFLYRTNQINAEKKALEKKLTEIDTAPMQNVERVRTAIPILEKCLDEYWKLDAKSKNEMLKAIIERVEYSKMQRNDRWDKSVDHLDLKIYLKI